MSTTPVVPSTSNGTAHGDVGHVATIGRPFFCFRCNRMLGYRVTAGLRVDTVILHPKQSFTCVKCKQQFKSVALAFAGGGGPAVKEDATPQTGPVQTSPVQIDARPTEAAPKEKTNVQQAKKK